MATAIIISAAAVAFVTWLLVMLVRALRAERATQHHTDRYPLLITLAIGTLIAVTAIVVTDDPRAGFRFGMGGLVIVWAVQALIRRRSQHRSQR